MTTHTFRKSLAFGTKAEDFISALYGHVLNRTNGRKSDFVFTQGTHAGQELELKTDGYISPNVFIERWSKVAVENAVGEITVLDIPKPGGMWQAHKNGTPAFGYFLPMYGKLVIYDTAELIKEVDKIIHKNNLQLVPVYNHDGSGGQYLSQGYKIPRTEILVHANVMRADLLSDAFRTRTGLEVNIDEKKAVYKLNGKTYNFPRGGRVIRDPNWSPYKGK